MRKTAFLKMLAILFLFSNTVARAEDLLIEDVHWPNSDKIPYLLTVEGAKPKYVVILMPGGVGRLEPRMEQGKLKFFGGGNFLIRSRGIFADEEFAAASSDADKDPQRMQLIVDDLNKRFAGAAIYIIGTSRSTLVTMSLAHSLDGKVAGFIHSSSMSNINGFNPQGLKSRNLLVHHKSDACHVTPPSSAIGSNKAYGTELILMEGGISNGDACEARAHHGYNGIEQETVDKIKVWIKQAGVKSEAKPQPTPEAAPPAKP